MPSSKDLCPGPLKQGKQGTCVAHAASQIVSSSLRLKYGVPVDEQNMVIVMKTVCESWAGSNMKTLCEQWNEAKKYVEDVDKEKLYRFDIKTKKVDFSQACSLANCFPGMPSISVSTGKLSSRHESHALAAFDYLPLTQELVAVNSWGSKDPYLYLKECDFSQGWFLDVEVVSVKVKNTEQAIPQYTPLYQSKRSACIVIPGLFYSNIDAADSAGNTVLHHAASRGLGGICDRFLERCIPKSVLKMNNDGQTALLMAAVAGELHVCQQIFVKLQSILENEYEVQDEDEDLFMEAADCYGRTSLHYLAESADELAPVVCRKILNLNGRLVNKEDRNGSNPLQRALITSRTQTSLVLLECGIFTARSINAVTTCGCSGVSLLHIATHRNMGLDVCSAILNHSLFKMADLQDSDGDTALHNAARNAARYSSHNKPLSVYKFMENHQKITNKMKDVVNNNGLKAHEELVE